MLALKTWRRAFDDLGGLGWVCATVAWCGLAVGTTMQMVRYGVTAGIAVPTAMAACALDVAVVVAASRKWPPNTVRHPLLWTALWLAIGALIRSSIARAVMPATFAVSDALAQYASGLITQLLWLGLAGMLSYAHSTRRSTEAFLGRSAQLLASERTRNEQVLGEIDRQIAQLVSQSVTEKLAAMRARIRELLTTAPSPSELLRLSESLRATQSEIVRPLSHAMIFEPGAPTPPSEAARQADQYRARLLEYPDLRLVLPQLLVALALSGILPAVAQLGLARFASVWLIVGTVVVGVSLLGYVAGRFTAVSRRLAARVIVTVGTWLIAGAGGAWVAIHLFPEDARVLVVAVAMAVVGAVFAIGWVAIEEATRRSFAAATHLAVTATTLSWENTQLEREIKRKRSSIGKLLHGQIQNGLLATSVAFAHSIASSSDRADPTIFRPALRQLDSDLASISEQIDGRDTDRSAGQVFESLTATIGLWRLGADITLSVDSAVIDATGSGGATARAVVEVVTEAIANSVRHGAARVIDVTVTLAGPCLMISVIDDGVGVPEPISPGAGLRTISEISIEWQLRNRPDGRSGAALLVKVPSGCTTGR